MDDTTRPMTDQAREPDRPARRRRAASPALVALNAGLLLVLGAVALGPDARAQASPDERLRGDYVVVGGDIPFGNANAIYILDTANQEMVAIRWNPGAGAAGRLEPIGYRDLRADAESRTGR